MDGHPQTSPPSTTTPRRLPARRRQIVEAALGLLLAAAGGFTALVGFAQSHRRYELPGDCPSGSPSTVYPYTVHHIDYLLNMLSKNLAALSLATAIVVVVMFWRHSQSVPLRIVRILLVIAVVVFSALVVNRDIWVRGAAF